MNALYETQSVNSNLILTNSVPNIAEKSSHGQKMRLPPTKISLPVKNNVDKAFVFVGNTTLTEKYV
jgi:hypothetical protein